MIRRCVTLLSACTVAACGSSTSAPTPPEEPSLRLRISGNQTGGAATDAVAAALLQCTTAQGYRPDRAVLQIADQALAERVMQVADVHVATASHGVESGSKLEGSAYIRRLAAEPEAPTDENGNGSNLDETLAAEYKKLAVRAGGVVTPGLRPILFGWRDAFADFATPGSADDFRRSTGQLAAGDVSMAQVAQGMLARLILGTYYVQRNRGSRPGETPEKGVWGLSLLQQVVAMEETLFSQLFMNGDALGAFQFPQDYKPTEDPIRWLPSRIRAQADARGFTSSYGLIDRSSELEVVAAMMRVGAELSFYKSDDNPNPNLRDIFRGNPFGKKPGSGGPGSGGQLDRGSEAEIVTWEDGVSEIMQNNCVFCHSESFPTSGFKADSYDNVLLGGDRSKPNSSNPIITRGNPDNSLFYRILLETPPAPFPRMPQFGELKPPQIDLIRTWILDGARSAPPGPPDLGVDLATVMFKNLIALHFDEKTAGLYERHYGGDGGEVAFVDVAATGSVLQALAAMQHLAPELTTQKTGFSLDLPTATARIAEFALEQLTTPTGEVFAEYDFVAGVARGQADLFVHARLTAGLLAVGHALGSTELVARGRLLAARLLDTFYEPAAGLFRSDLAQVGRRYDPAMLAALIDALREMARAGAGGSAVTAEVAFDEFLNRITGVLAYSELEGTGETIGDGQADSDGDGIPEPAFAGGPFGRPPLLVGEIKEGPEYATDLNGPVRWTTHVHPLFRQTCAQCHLDGANRGGYRLDTPLLVRKKGTDNPPVPLVVPFDPEASYLYRKLVDRRPAGGDQMPLQTPPLDARGKEIVRRWILEGASSR